ncbi:MAG TPA: phosphoribosylformylglycinamidine synthase subunit PurL [Ktedonobacterales bacterium]|nr:phosphoribosylformylglycinamidine synthase subunit PurL [Ktedonobacterales bacterium]
MASELLTAGEPTAEQVRARAIYRDFGLRDDEYERICARLGRLPNYVETGIFSVLWSEHCSYKSSKKHLGAFPTTGPAVLQGPGENAGIVDIGGGLGLAFKMESHNHPSAIEPYQGAATGAGGIIRDIFTMGARPIALLDSLRFGPPTDARNRYLFERVVAGIGGYGNCIGIPTVGGEVVFDEAYTHNPLVNAMCVGLIRHDQIARGTASGVGNPVLVVGAKTGRDGIHGATFASVEDPHSRERSAVQVGDPFMEKLLLEACLELLASDAVVGLQDMGAAGLTSSSAEMAARAGSGIDLDVALVPRRETGMTPYEVMLSESQERMLVVLRRGHADEARRVFAKWGLDAVVVGTVTASGLLRVYDGERLAAAIPVAALVDEAPVYDRPATRPAYLDDPALMAADTLPESGDLAGDLLDLLARPTIASKAWVYDQYDSMVRTGTVQLPGGDAAVVALPDFSRAVAMTTDGNGRYVYLDPRAGGMHAVMEAARNLVCAGARPLAVTDCLNFGNPEKPGVFYQFVESVHGLAEACRALGTPVVSGNVSFYNETDGQDIFPTPVVGMVGVVDDLAHLTTPALTAPGDLLLVLGGAPLTLGAGEYAAMRAGRPLGPVPPLDLAGEARTLDLVREGIRAGWVRAAHDVSDGGLAVALAEMCIAGRLGAELAWETPGRADLALFGEGGGRMVLEVPAAERERVAARAAALGVAALWLGAVSARDKLRITRVRAGARDGSEETRAGTSARLTLPVSALRARWEEAIPWIMR